MNNEQFLTMFDATELDSLIAFEDIRRTGYPLEAEDAWASWEHGGSYEPAWYMDLSPNIRHEIKSINLMKFE